MLAKLTKYLENPQVKAVFLLAGLILGAGMFGLPATFAKSGALWGSIIWLIATLVVLLTHLMYLELTRALGSNKRLVGDVQEVFGESWSRFATVCVLVTNYGALLAYMVLGGLFLRAVFGTLVGEMVFSFLILVLGAYLVYRGMKLVDRVNAYLTVALIGGIVCTILVALSKIHLPNLIYNDNSQAAASYGVLIFSLFGLNAIPELRTLLDKSRVNSNGRHEVIIGTLISAGLTLLFTLAVLAVNGPYVSSDSIAGLVAVFGRWFGIVLGAVGFLAIFTSFIVIGLSQREMLARDYDLKPIPVMLITFVPILIVYLIGFRDLQNILSFTGSILNGSIVILVAAMYLKLISEARKSGRKVLFANWVPMVVIGATVLGVVQEVMR